MKATFERWYTTAFQSLQVRARWRRAAGVPALRVAAPAARGASPREGRQRWPRGAQSTGVCCDSFTHCDQRLCETECKAAGAVYLLSPRQPR